jgi:hypothetical protein
MNKIKIISPTYICIYIYIFLCDFSKVLVNVNRCNYTIVQITEKNKKRLYSIYFLKLSIWIRSTIGHYIAFLLKLLSMSSSSFFFFFCLNVVFVWFVMYVRPSVFSFAFFNNYFCVFSTLYSFFVRRFSLLSSLSLHFCV